MNEIAREMFCFHIREERSIIYSLDRTITKVTQAVRNQIDFK